MDLNHPSISDSDRQYYAQRHNHEMAKYFGIEEDAPVKVPSNCYVEINGKRYEVVQPIELGDLIPVKASEYGDAKFGNPSLAATVTLSIPCTGRFRRDIGKFRMRLKFESGERIPRKPFAGYVPPRKHGKR